MWVVCIFVLVTYWLYFFFFFQAEDGIRDTSVTGVQTCALPIWDAPGTRAPRRAPPRSGPGRGPRPPPDRGRARRHARGPPRGRALPAPDPPRRSEERRVGKECRCRWYVCH